MAELTSAAFNDLQHMLNDTDFTNLLFMDEGKDVAKSSVIHKDGSITIGRQRWKWCNWLFKDQKTLSPNDVCLRLIQTVSGRGNTRNKEAFDALTREFIDTAIGLEDYSAAITRIFLGYRINSSDIQRIKEQVITNSDIGDKNIVITECRQNNGPSTEGQAFVLCQDSAGQLVILGTSSKTVHPVKGVQIKR